MLWQPLQTTCMVSSQEVFELTPMSMEELSAAAEEICWSTPADWVLGTLLAKAV